MPHPLSKTLVIQQADGSEGEKYDVLVDEDGKLQWWEESVGEGGVKAGDAVWRKWGFWGGGMGQVRDIQQGGYYYSKNCFVGNPWAIRPRPTKTTVTLTDNATPVVRFFEAESASGTKYLYAITETKVFKVRLDTMTLVNTKELTAETVNFKTGSYVGTGTTQSITGLGFTPDIVLIKCTDYDIGDELPAIRTTGMITTKVANGTAFSGVISSLDADGFTVISDAYVNRSGKTYAWMAWEQSSGLLKTATYSGDGEATQAITGVGFEPDILWVFDQASTEDEAELVARHSTFSDDQAMAYWDFDPFSDCVKTLDADGFTVANNARVNTAGHTYRYIAFKALENHLTVGTYTGDGTDNRDLGDADLDPDVEYTPTYVLVTRYGAPRTCHRSDKNAGDSTMMWSTSINASNYIQGLIEDGFTIGSTEVNSIGQTYHFAAWMPLSAQNAKAGQPAKWNGIWELPLGDDASWVALTTISDGEDDDVWTTRANRKATHFCVMHNELARAYDGRKIELCSADDVSDSGNWGGEYYVGQPGTVITNLVEWEDELAIMTEDGMYMYDGVAIARQQLRLMGGVSHEDNGKGSINWMLNILVGTADGFMRWIRDASPQGPDAIPGYVNAEDTSDEPIHLHHYGSAFLQDWIFNAAKDPSDNYHIFTLRPKEEGFNWDGLLTDTNAITILYIDPERRLWFNYGNNIAYIALRRGGEPGAGTFGEDSSTGSIYLPEITLADDADVRLRVVKVRVQNSKTGFAWKVYAYRDGGAAAQVGAAGGITADGESCLYFAPGSNLTAKRLRLRIDWVASGYTPTSDPPEILSIEVWGEAMPSDADIIRSLVDLESDGISQSANYTNLKAHENAGVRVLRHPITDEELYVTVFKTELFDIIQRDQQEPTGALMLHMRRGDTS